MRNELEFPAADDFDYSLPDEAIARHPVHPRSAARLLFMPANGKEQDLLFSDLPSLLEAGHQLWHNNTRVLHARLMLAKPTGGRLELFLLEPADSTMEEALASTVRVAWKVMVRGGKRWKQGEANVSWVDLDGQSKELKAKRLEAREGMNLVELSWNSGASFAELIDELGAVPLPPYLGRDAVATDADDYQTIYAEVPGSVAAPTAGLHYDAELWATLRDHGVVPQAVTLHVGAGTFKPLGHGSLNEHSMHSEQCMLSREALIALAHPQTKRWATGTTTLRTLESLFWYAVLFKEQGAPPDHVPQWVWKEKEHLKHAWGWNSIEAAATWLLDATDGGVQFSTSIMIIPGYAIQSVDALVTNFHMPKSSLLCLVAALMGKEWRAMYMGALKRGYRFLSYGDGSVLEVRR